jgi:diaminobutyrate-2-oxoglutarate transaminase
MSIFDRLESEVRGYCRSWPAVFASSEGAELTDESGRIYLDFFAGAGVLNYGHNHPRLQRAAAEYLLGGGVVHSLDMMTVAKRRFLETFERVILEPRRLDYKVQFPGPTGTNAVESALKLARKVTGRSNVAAFTNAFHGMTLGSLACTGNQGKRAGAGIPLSHATRLPFCGSMSDDGDTLEYFEFLLENGSSGVETPAAVIVETIQAEGGVKVGSIEWLRRLRRLTSEHEILLIVDDIQVGCGRTGPFFSFEPAGIVPDIVCLSKSLSGLGFPLAVVLMRPDLDVWEPGEHNGTFRGFNPAFVTATEALETFWTDSALSFEVARKSHLAHQRLESIAAEHPGCGELRGRGLILGLECKPGLAGKVAREAFGRGLIIETAGPEDEVLKLLPPLTISDDELAVGLDIIADSFRAVCKAEHRRRANGAAIAEHHPAA